MPQYQTKTIATRGRISDDLGLKNTLVQKQNQAKRATSLVARAPLVTIAFERSAAQPVHNLDGYVSIISACPGHWNPVFYPAFVSSTWYIL